MDELDRLKQQNEDRIKSIEDKYFQKKEEIRKVKDIFHERADLRETKEKRVDSSMNYPTYGRGMDPAPTLNTFMINQNLCHDGNNSPQRRKKNDNQDGDDQLFSDREKGQRPKIISPRRQKFET